MAVRRGTTRGTGMIPIEVLGRYVFPRIDLADAINLMNVNHAMRSEIPNVKVREWGSLEPSRAISGLYVDQSDSVLVKWVGENDTFHVMKSIFKGKGLFGEPSQGGVMLRDLFNVKGVPGGGSIPAAAFVPVALRSISEGVTCSQLNIMSEFNVAKSNISGFRGAGSIPRDGLVFRPYNFFGFDITDLVFRVEEDPGFDLSGIEFAEHCQVCFGLRHHMTDDTVGLKFECPHYRNDNYFVKCSVLMDRGNNEFSIKAVPAIGKILDALPRSATIVLFSETLSATQNCLIMEWMRTNHNIARVKIRIRQKHFEDAKQLFLPMSDGTIVHMDCNGLTGNFMKRFLEWSGGAFPPIDVLCFGDVAFKDADVDHLVKPFVHGCRTLSSLMFVVTVRADTLLDDAIAKIANDVLDGIPNFSMVVRTECHHSLSRHGKPNIITRVTMKRENFFTTQKDFRVVRMF
jgi:hypothetical protein